MSARGTWPRKSLEERVLSRYAVLENGCWEFTGGLNSAGYGIIMPNGSEDRLRAHRVVYEILVGPIPKGMDLDHLCHNSDLSCPGGVTCRHRRCVNPDHLEPATRATNVKRGAARVRGTHCSQGHEFTFENTRIRRGARECRICSRTYRREHWRAAHPNSPRFDHRLKATS